MAGQTKQLPLFCGNFSLTPLFNVVAEDRPKENRFKRFFSRSAPLPRLKPGVRAFSI
jgi:hypothetical protein